MSGVGGAYFEKATKKGWLVDAGDHEDVAGETGVDERVFDVMFPTGFIRQEGGRAGIPAKPDVLVERPPEGFLHFGVGPVGNVDGFEAAGEGLGKTSLDEEGRGTEENDLDGTFVEGVGVPFFLDDFAPVLYFLYFVDDEEEFFARVSGSLETSTRPSLAEP